METTIDTKGLEFSHKLKISIPDNQFPELPANLVALKLIDFNHIPLNLTHLNCNIESHDSITTSLLNSLLKYSKFDGKLISIVSILPDDSSNNSLIYILYPNLLNSCFQLTTIDLNNGYISNLLSPKIIHQNNNEKEEEEEEEKENENGSDYSKLTKSLDTHLINRKSKTKSKLRNNANLKAKTTFSTPIKQIEDIIYNEIRMKLSNPTVSTLNQQLFNLILSNILFKYRNTNIDLIPVSELQDTVSCFLNLLVS